MHALAQHVADAAHCVNQTRPAVQLGLASQIPDVDLQRVRGIGEVVTPHLPKDRVPSEDLARVRHQQLEESELDLRQIELLSSTLRAPLVSVQLELAVAQDPLAGARPPDQRADPREEL